MFLLSSLPQKKIFNTFATALLPGRTLHIFCINLFLVIPNYFVRACRSSVLPTFVH